MKLPQWANKSIDAGGLVLGLSVDLIAGVICFIKMAPDTITQIAFVALSIMMVLFIARAWVKKQRLFWFLCMAVVFFFDLSFILVSTDIQTNNLTVENDQELKRLTEKSDKADEALGGLRLEYSKAVKRETLEELNAQIKEAEQTAKNKERERKERYELVSGGKITSKPITAATIFSAIPDAIAKGRILELIIWAFVAGAIQGMIVSSLNEIEPTATPKRRRRREEQPPAEELVQQWVDINYMALQSGNSDKIIDAEVFKKFCADRKIKFTDGAYRSILSSATRAGVLRTDGVIIEKIKTEAVKKILTTAPTWRNMNRKGGPDDSNRQDDSS